MTSTPEKALPGSEADAVSGLFSFWNGDEYEGDYAGVRDKQKVVMEGYGVYKTADGQLYVGHWESDSLKEAEGITFADGTRLSGTLDEMRIVGPGRYTFKENVEIEAEFSGNRATGTLHLKDPTGHMWRAAAAGDQDLYVGFRPCHSFWQSILKLSPKTEYFYSDAQEGEEEEDEENEGSINTCLLSNERQ